MRRFISMSEKQFEQPRKEGHATEPDQQPALLDPIGENLLDSEENALNMAYNYLPEMEATDPKEEDDR
jgi:hypothetical protein